MRAKGTTSTARGVTLIELVVVVAIIAVVAAMAIPVMRAAAKNARVAGVALDLQEKLKGLPTRAMRDQTELLAIVVDALGDDPTNCVAAREECAAIYVVEPAAGFRLNEFNPSVPGEGWKNLTRIVYTDHLGKGIRFYTRAAGRPAPPPFAAVTAFHPAILGRCGGVRDCVAVRFRADGSAGDVPPDGGPGGAALGTAFVIGSDLSLHTGDAPEQENRASDQRGIVVTFPAAIVRAYPVAR
jgi:prepilin-type N-terminal cleavage/methylation domain-containing protein